MYYKKIKHCWDLINIITYFTINLSNIIIIFNLFNNKYNSIFHKNRVIFGVDDIRRDP